MTVDQVGHGLQGLARLHSQYWAFSAVTHPELAWVQTWEPTEGFAEGLASRIPKGLERGAACLPEEVGELGVEAILSAWARVVRSLAQGPLTLLHGDPHIGNTYVLPHDDIGFLDWQVVRRGNWSHDVGYFLVSALTVADRRRSEAELIEAYRGALAPPGGERPSKEEAWLRYRAVIGLRPGGLVGDPGDRHRPTARGLRAALRALRGRLPRTRQHRRPDQSRCVVIGLDRRDKVGAKRRSGRRFDIR